MNERQRRFCEFYAKNPNATEAARLAGYAARTARSQGQRLLKNEEVRSYIRELQAQLRDERIADAAEARSFLTSVMRDSTERTNARIRAGDLLLKSAGGYIPSGGDPPSEQEDKESESTEHAVITLPWNGRGLFTAYENESGEIVPIHAPDDLLIYVSQKQLKLFEKAVTMDALSDEDEEITIKE